MSRIVFFVCIFNVCLQFAFCQNSTIANQSEKPVFGINCGFICSKFFENTDKNSMHISQVYEIDELIRPGLCAGFSVSLINRKHFSMQPELNYFLFCQRIRYFLYTNDHWGSYTKVNADFNLYSSHLQYSILPKFFFGKNQMFYIGISPSIFIPLGNFAKGEVEYSGISMHMQFINDSLEIPVLEPFTKVVKDKSIGVSLNRFFSAFIFYGFKLPFEKADICSEFRLYYNTDSYTQVGKHFFCSLNISYQFRRTNNLIPHNL